MQYLSLRIIVESKYSDLNDLKQPIKPYLGDLGFWPLNPYKRLSIRPTIERHELDLQDSIFTYFSNEEPLVFNKVWERESVTFATQEFFQQDVLYQSLVSIDIGIATNVYQSKRKVLTIFEVTGFLGGIFELFEIIFGFILGTISSYTFKRQILDELKESRDQYLELKAQLDDLRKEKDSSQNNSNLAPRDLPEENKINIEENKIVEEEKILERLNGPQNDEEGNCAALEDLQRKQSQKKV